MNDIINEFDSKDLKSIELTSVYEIEGLLVYMQDLTKKMESLKELKRFRATITDERINFYNSRIEDLRAVVLNTLKNFKEKTVEFPGTGKVTRRQSSATWLIDNDEQLIEFLEKNQLADDVVHVKKVIDKRKAMKVIKDLPKNEKVPGISKVPGKESISISYDKQDDDESNIKELSQKPTINLDDLESLEV